MARTLLRTLTVAGVPTDRVLSFQETHRLGRPASLTIEALFEQCPDIEDVVGTDASLEYGYDGETPHVFVGTVQTVSIVGTTFMVGRTYQYAFEVVSILELLSRDFGCDIYQDKTTPDVIKAFLTDCGVPSDKFDWRLTATSYKPRDFCVRYQESALAFITRLCEKEGIYFFSEVGDDGAEKIVFADDSTAAKPVDGDATFEYQRRTALNRETDTVFELSERRAVRSGKFVLRDFDFEHPPLDMTATATADDDTDLEVYDYPGGYFDPGQGKALAQVRLDAEQAGLSTLSIASDSPRIAAGRKLTIAHSTADGDYFVTSVTTTFVTSQGMSDEDRSDTVSVNAELLPAQSKYRLPLVTPRPTIHGPQTAVVVAPTGSQAEEIHTDQHGRAKVKFHWDRSATTDDKASAWFRTEQMQTSGSMMLPRVNWEVVVEFLEGDPDRPIVGGRIYNAGIMPPYKLPEGKTRTSLKTASTPGGGGMNEIRFEDKAGSEEILINSQKDTNIAVANNKTKNVANNETQIIGSNSKLSVGANQDVKITKGSKTEIKAHQKVHVGGNRTVEVNAVTGLNVSADSTNTVTGNQQSMVGNPLQALLALAAEKAIEYAQAKAGDALAAIDAHVQGKVDQAMGPINGVLGQAQAMGDSMNALRGGDLSAAGGLMGAAGGLPSAAGLLGGMAAATPAAGTSASSAGISASNMLGGAVQNAIQKGISGGASALGQALGIDDAANENGESNANTGGPKGDVDGVDQTDRTKGPGHTLYKITGKHDEKVGSIKALVALQGINTNVTGASNENVSIAKLELVYKDYAESVEGKKDETALGLVVVSKGDETEQVTKPKTVMVGGAIVDKVKGAHAIDATGSATFVAALQKLEAKTSITLKCGPSQVIISDSGVTVESPMITITAGKIQLPKAVTET